MSLLFTAVLFVFVYFSFALPCLFILALSCSACRRSSLKLSLFVLTLARSASRRSSLQFLCSFLPCVFLLANLLRSLQFCLLLLPLTRSLCRFSSIALHLLTLALCLSLSLSLSGRLALRLKPVVYTLQSLCCCLLT